MVKAAGQHNTGQGQEMGQVSAGAGSIAGKMSGNVSVQVSG